MQFFRHLSSQAVIIVVTIIYLLLGVASLRAYHMYMTVPEFRGVTAGIECLILFGFNSLFIVMAARYLSSREHIADGEKLFMMILNGLNDGMFDYDVATNRCIYSTSYELMLGYTPGELNGEHDIFYTIVHPDDMHDASLIFMQFLRGEIATYKNVFRARHKDGRWLWLLSRGIAMRDKKNRICRLIGTSSDITEQKQHEEELAYFIGENELQKLELELAMKKVEAASEAKSDFLATMSHEIRTPMNAVVGLSGLMLNTPLNDKQKRMIETLHSNADILLRLVNDLLDISRIEAASVDIEMRPFSFDAVFESLRGMFDTQMAAKKLRFEINNELGARTFMGDATRIQQILVNLINNAYKFTPTGLISVTSSLKQISENDVQVVLSVADTGVGIPPDKQARVFDKFVQADQTISRRFGGSGLGLAICRSLAELMGGSISLVSTENVGTVFSVALPFNLQDKNVSVPQDNVQTTEGNLLSGRILLVEDYESNILVATLMLEGMGYAVDVATTGQEAIRKVELCTTPYHVVLMDVQMPDMDGYETTKRIRAIDKARGMQHFIIGVTAHALLGDREKCIASGMDDYLQKPINPDLLESIIRKSRLAA